MLTNKIDIPAAEAAFTKAEAAGRAKIFSSGAAVRIRGNRLPLTAADKEFDDCTLSIDVRALAAWRCSPQLQAEFPNVDAYVAYRKAAERGGGIPHA